MYKLSDNIQRKKYIISRSDDDDMMVRKSFKQGEEKILFESQGRK